VLSLFALRVAYDTFFRGEYREAMGEGCVPTNLESYERAVLCNFAGRLLGAEERESVSDELMQAVLRVVALIYF
jgi:hypothetical protein